MAFKVLFASSQLYEGRGLIDKQKGKEPPVSQGLKAGVSVPLIYTVGALIGRKNKVEV